MQEDGQQREGEGQAGGNECPPYSFVVSSVFTNAGEQFFCDFHGHAFTVWDEKAIFFSVEGYLFMDFFFVVDFFSILEFIVSLSPEDFMATDVHVKALVTTPLVMFEFSGRDIDERKFFFPVCIVPTRYG